MMASLLFLVLGPSFEFFEKNPTMGITIRRRHHSQPLVEDSEKNGVECPEKSASSKSLPLRLLKLVLLTLSAATVLINTATSMDKFVYTIDKNVIKDETATVVSIPFPPPASEWLGDIDTDTNSSVMCGYWKCAFPSRTNQKHLDRDRTPEERYGYLVSHNHHKSWLISQFRGTKKAQELAGNFSIRQLHLASPQKMNLTESLKGELNKNLVIDDGSDHVPYPFAATKRNRNQLVVQPIKFVPEGSILFGCIPDRRGFAKEEMEKFLANQTALSAPELLEFEARLRFDLKETLMMLNSTEGSCLRSDFQVFIDPIAGRIYHIDFDRCFPVNDLESWEGCPEALQSYVEHLIQSRAAGRIVAENTGREELGQVSKLLRFLHLLGR